MKVRNNNYWSIVHFVFLFLLLTVNPTFGQVDDDTVYVWYGNMDETPVIGIIEDTIYVDVYIYTTEDAYISDLHLCLGAMDQCVDDFLEGVIHYPFYYAGFGQPEGSPPNPPGWSSQSFVAWVDLMGPPDWLHFDIPTLIISYRLVLANDPSLMGDTIECLGPGMSSTLGGSAAGDTLGMFVYPIVEYFSPIYFVGPGESCDYLPGDINSDDNVMGNDVTYGVRYFKGLGSSPPDSCYNFTAGEWLYSAGDVNGNCEFTGSDITYLVAYFKGINPEILWCEWTPPIGG